MLRRLSAVLVALLVAAAALLAGSSFALAEEQAQDMYRLYNPYSGEHFYTASPAEKDALSRIGKQTVLASEIVGSDAVEGYRNKGILAVGTADGLVVSGFYRERSHEVIPVSQCRLQDHLAHRAAAAVTDFILPMMRSPIRASCGTSSAAELLTGMRGYCVLWRARASDR